MIYLYDRDGHRHGYYTPKQFVWKYQITDRSLYNWLKWGLPYTELGEQILIPALDSRLWIEGMVREGEIKG